MERIVIIGTGNTANIVYNFIKQYQLFEVIGFAVDRAYLNTLEYLDLPVYATEDLHKIVDKVKDKLFCAVLWNRLNADRKSFYMKLKEQGYSFANLISPKAVVNGVILGDNCWVNDYAKIDYYTTVGNDVFIKSSAFVGDNTVLEDHCFIAENTTIGGGVRIGEQTFVGLGATIFDEVKVGTKCVVGAATALKRNLTDFCVYKTGLDNYVVKCYPETEIENKLLFKKNIR